MAFARFEFAMTDALVDQIVAQFDDSIDGIAVTPWSPLDQAEVDVRISGDDRTARGVYLLGRVLDEAVVTAYVGQSNSALYDRLSRHARFFQDRHGLPYNSIRFKALGVIIFDSVALEERLINVYHTKWNKNDPFSGWNGSGIGSNDTGGGRDKQTPSGFDRRFPIDITLTKADLLVPGAFTARQIYRQIKAHTPYTVRIEPTALGQHAEFQTPPIQIDNASTSVREAFELLLGVLPPNWYVKVNPVRVLIQRGETPTGAIVNPVAWPPAEWLAGHDQSVVFRNA